MGWRGTPQRKTAERGYDHQHVKARKAALAKHRPSDPCCRCGLPLGPAGPWLHLDHNHTRTGYLGLSHADCNVKAASAEGLRRQHTRKRPRLSDIW